MIGGFVMNKEVGGTADFKGGIGGEGMVEMDFEIGDLALKKGSKGGIVHMTL